MRTGITGKSVWIAAMLAFSGSLALLTAFNASASIGTSRDARAGAPCQFEDYDVMLIAFEDNNVRIAENQPGAARRLHDLLKLATGPKCINVDLREKMNSDPDVTFVGFKVSTFRVVFNVIVIFSERDGRMIGIDVTEGAPSNVIPFPRR